MILKLSRITAASDSVTFELEKEYEGSIFVSGFSPALSETRKICLHELMVCGKTATLKCSADSDYTYLRWIASDTDDVCLPVDTALAGKMYVEHISGSAEDYEYPVADTKKGLQVTMVKDAIELGVRHAALNVNLGDFMMPEAVEGDTIEFEFCGKTYYIRKSVTERNDKKVKELSDNGIIITFILLNSRNWTVKIPEDFWNVIKHPRYADEGTISQFDVMREAGCRYYMAFLAFIAQRYTRADQKYGRSVGFIVGNEVNSGYVWCNAGETPVENYTYEYTTALRLAWQIGLKYYSGMRVYVSLDHFWTGANFDAQPLRYYGSRAILENINKYCLAEGQVGWNIAHHPYPEDLNFPDFWNDKSTTDNFDTFRITFNNLEVLARFTYRDEYLFEGKRRRIILSEQGFNSHWTPESEVLQAMAYGKAYKKVMQIPEVDSFILHAHTDNKFEFGLNLGLWRRKKDGDGLDQPKPIYYVFKAIDKKDEKGVYHWERY